MSLFEQLTLGSVFHKGTPVDLNGAVSLGRIETARARTLYRATLTADLLDRRKLAEMASWSPTGGIRIVPGAGPGDDPSLSGLAFDFTTFEDAAAFLRKEVVPVLLADARRAVAETGDERPWPVVLERPEQGWAQAAE